MNIFRSSYGQKRPNQIPRILLPVIFVTLVLITSSTTVNAQHSHDRLHGNFNHTQTDPSGNIEWDNTGNWSLTGTNSASPSFDAIIDMVKPDGSAGHQHEVNDLVVSAQPTVQNSSTVIEGTTTITMRDGPVTDEPTTITLNGKDISLYFDPAKIDDHFGNQSITGSIVG